MAVHPDTEATVEMVSDTSSVYFSTTTDSQGGYIFNNVPPGQFWVMASSSRGSSNPVRVTVRAGEITTVEKLRTLAATLYGTRGDLRTAGGHILVDGDPVAGATVWPLGGLVWGDKPAVTDETGYFSFLYIQDHPVVAVSGNRWAVTTLEPNSIIEIELDRSGPHPAPPPGPAVTPVPVHKDVEIIVPTPPVEIQLTPFIPEIEVIVPSLLEPTIIPRVTAIRLTPERLLQPTLVPVEPGGP